MKILTAAQMGEVDRLTSERFLVPSILLMENAGRSFCEELTRMVPALAGKRIRVLCGRGNNGGDGFVVARHLALAGAHPLVALVADPASLGGDALANFEIVRAMGLPLEVFPVPSGAAAALGRAPLPDVIVDALFGTGLSRPVGPDFQPLLGWIDRAAAHAFVASVDIPSGLMADRSEVEGPAVRAHLTVTFSALKPALGLPPAADRAGRVVVAPIGSPPALFDHPEYRLNLADEELVRRVVPPRRRESHKGSFGHTHIVAGSRGKSGAALMAALAALRAGAGLVTLWLPEGTLAGAAGRFPELMTEPLPETPSGTFDASGLDRVLERLGEADALVVGPGMTTEPSTRRLIRELTERSPVPVVLDADGLNAFALCETPPRNRNDQPVILTPHPGEMARLGGTSVAEVQRDRLGTARQYAREHGCHVILKGFQTVSAAPGGELFLNPTGNPGMATGGTGDLLAGMAGRFAAAWRLAAPGAGELVRWLAAAVYLHGLAGDLAAEEKGMESLLATDLLSALPGAFRKALGR